MRRHKKEKPYDEEEDTSLHMVEKPSMTDTNMCLRMPAF